MKASALFCTLILSLASMTATAAATPIALSGEFKFQGKVLEGPVADFRVVYTFSDAGKAELQELMNQGYGCESKPRATALCKKFLSDTTIPAELQQRISARLDGYSVAFLNHAPDLPDTPDSNTPDVKEWRISQKVRIGETYYPFYRYQILGDTLHKVILGEKGDATAPFFIVRAADTLGIAMEMSLKNPKGYRLYYVEAVLPRD